MAAKKTYTEAALVQYVGHITQEGYFKHAPSNKEIDMNLHDLNINLTPEKGSTKKEIIKHYRERKKQLYCYNRSDVVTALEWTITAPEGLNEEQRIQFFKTSLDYLKATYGEENIITSFVHANEGIKDTDGKVIFGHWHSHTLIIPVTDITKRKPIHKDLKQKICNNEVCTLKHLKNWHKLFQKFCDEHLPFKAQVYLGGSTGANNRTVKELKAETKYEIEHQKVLKLQKEVEELKSQLTSVNKEKEHSWTSSRNGWGQRVKEEERTW